MPKEYQAQQVINGSWGEAWMDGEYLAQVISLKAEITPKKTAIQMVQRLNEGQKMTGLELKGEIKLHKINSYIMKKMSEYFKRGKMMTCTIISNVRDPDGWRTRGIIWMSIRQANFGRLGSRENGRGKLQFYI